MSARNLTVFFQTRPSAELAAADDLLALEDLEKWLYNGQVLRKLRHYRDVQLLINHLDSVPWPSVTATVLRFLGTGRCRFADDQGRTEQITFPGLVARILRLLGEAVCIPPVLWAVKRDARQRLEKARQPRGPVPSPQLDLPAIYLRTLLDFGLKAGGSVGHIAGVLNNLDAFTGPPIFLTSVAIPTLRSDIPVHLIPRKPGFNNFTEVRMLRASQWIPAWAESVLRSQPVSFVYQRNGRYDYTGVVFAQQRKVPLVLEYNGSEVWIGKNWGRRLRYEKLGEDIELLNLHAADLVVVVSKPSRDELVERGIDPGKILVNPNGVDPVRYSPSISGEEVRQTHGLIGKTVIGFIGTFELWHGAEVLAEAFGRLLAAEPSYRDRVRLLFIGDGTRMKEVRANLDRQGVADLAIFTGLVPQVQGPAHLAACDILASPHVPNPDGTPFFGSPTKLFEYMAMGKGIIASDLEQIGEVLAHDRTAWLVRPGDPDDLTRGLKVLLDDPERRHRLGAAARAEVVARYTWREHTQRIIEKLKERCP